MCLAAANRIINRTNAYNTWQASLTAGTSGTETPKVKLNGKRLQKILYLCQLVWFIDHDDSQMITEDFEAWPNGPVIREIYDHFSVFQDGDMLPLQNIDSRSLNNEERDLINKVVDITIEIPTEKIIDYTHLPGSPWSQVYVKDSSNYRIIPKSAIRDYIKEQKNKAALFEFLHKK